MTREEVKAAVRNALEKRAGPIAGGGSPGTPPGGAGAPAPAAVEAPRPPATPSPGDSTTGSPEANPPLEFVSAREVEDAHRRGDRKLHVAAGGIVTPLARDAAAKHGLELVRLSGGGGDKPAPRRVRKVALAADHGGYALKEALEKAVAELGYEVLDLGTHSPAPAEYPDLAYELAKKVAAGAVDRGIVVDGAGIGSAIVANKVGGVRAAHCHDLYEARNSRLHNDANVLSLGGRTLGEGLAREIVKEWLVLEFEGGRHARRVARIEEIERAEGRIR